MLRNYKQHSVCSPREELSCQDFTKPLVRLAYRAHIEETPRGLRRVCERVVVDDSIPMTPQTGLDCMIGDISFAISQGLDLEHFGNDLSVVQRGSRLEAARYFEQAIKSSERNFEKYNESNS